LLRHAASIWDEKGGFGEKSHYFWGINYPKNGYFLHNAYNGNAGRLKEKGKNMVRILLLPFGCGICGKFKPTHSDMEEYPI
jgi:hypothetical protein